MLNRIDVDKIKKGDSSAFQYLFELLYPKLMAHACRFTDEQTARDLVQDLFTSYWEQKIDIDADNILAFLYRSLHYKCLDYLKHQNVVAAYESRIRLAEQRISSMTNYLENNEILKQLAAQDIREIIESSIKKLPPRSAEAFRLCYFEDLSHKEIAEQMGISHRTVETHIHKAVNFLRSDIKDLLILLFVFHCNF